MVADGITPLEITRANAHDLKIIWPDGQEHIYPSRELRLACPCAGCVDEMTGQIRIVPTHIPEDVHPMKIDVVGRYAITIQWSDGHHTGIYTFERLRKMHQ